MTANFLKSGTHSSPSRPVLEDFGIKEERYRMNIGKKIRYLVWEMGMNSITGVVCDNTRYRNILSKMKSRIDDKIQA